MVMSKRTKKIYFTILLLSIVIGLLVPFAINKFIDSKDAKYYYPQDNDREDYLKDKKLEVK